MPHNITGGDNMKETCACQCEKATVRSEEERKKLIKALEKQMEEFADCLAFEEAAAIRDEIAAIKEQYGD